MAQPFACGYGREEAVHGWTHSLNGGGREHCHALAVPARPLLDLGSPAWRVAEQGGVVGGHHLLNDRVNLTTRHGPVRVTVGVGLLPRLDQEDVAVHRASRQNRGIPRVASVKSDADLLTWNQLAARIFQAHPSLGSDPAVWRLHKAVEVVALPLVHRHLVGSCQQSVKVNEGRRARVRLLQCRPAAIVGF